MKNNIAPLKYSIFLLVFLVAGCQYLTNNYSINPLLSDETVNQRVITALNNDENLKNLPIRVDTLKKVVYLSGYVQTIRQSDTAMLIATRVPGVGKVENNIIVRKS